ncbi:hypothetical protein EDB85DRAFT_2279352 [Lactarius pseudohatsudake]|nr:hypothetical protein EDB85DRAFT_2279808 [Lactarius pseudohatsudake]KAH9018424.1 hypothetical protein EDB85DRAFT_2279352 [Lactarius pseudohatsudake]
MTASGKLDPEATARDSGFWCTTMEANLDDDGRNSLTHYDNFDSSSAPPVRKKDDYEYGYGNDIVVLNPRLRLATHAPAPYLLGLTSTAAASPHAHPAPQGLKAHKSLPSLPHARPAMPSRHTSPATTPSRRDTTSTPRASPATTQAMTTAVARQLRRWRQADDDNYVQGGQDKDDDSKVTMTHRRRLRSQQSGRESATATTLNPPQYQVAATPLHHSTRAPAIPQVPATSATPSVLAVSWPVIAVCVSMNILLDQQRPLKVIQKKVGRLISHKDTDYHAQRTAPRGVSSLQDQEGIKIRFKKKQKASRSCFKLGFEELG